MIDMFQGIKFLLINVLISSSAFSQNITLDYSGLETDTIKESDFGDFHIKYYSKDTIGNLIFRGSKSFIDSNIVDSEWISENGMTSIRQMYNTNAKTFFIGFYIIDYSSQLFWFHENGKIKAIENYEYGGVPNGWFYIYSVEGDLTSSMLFVKGKKKKLKKKEMNRKINTNMVEW